MRVSAAVLGLALSITLEAPASAQQLAPVVARYLDGFAQRHPSIAAGNGLHAYDHRLDDFSAAAIRREISALKRDRRALHLLDSASLTADERVDRVILLGVIDGWLLEQETLRNWTRNPMLYASALADGVHNLMTMESAPAPERMRRLTQKLAGVPALLRAARQNIKAPPRLFVERGIVMFRGAADMLRRDVALAFAAEQGTPVMDSLLRAATRAAPLVDAYVEELETGVLPRANGSFVIGAPNLARRYRAEELIAEPLADLVQIGERELANYQRQFRQAAARIDSTRAPLDLWRAIRRDHPRPGELVEATQRIVDSLTSFVRARNLAAIIDGERVRVAPSKPFDLGFASMHASPPLEPTPVTSWYYVTDARAGAPLAEQNEWLERFNYASLAITSAHEAMPGHWLHSIYMRRTPGTVRRIWIGLNPFPQPSSGQDGWAHYAEQLVVEEGFGDRNPRYVMAQLSDALTRVCRLLSGIRVHTSVWTLEEAQRCFTEQAYLAPAAARREAERATYDPTYGGYFLGKIGMLALRRDYAAQQGSAFSLRTFHERIMSNGIAPLWAHRQLLLPGDTSRVIK
jgi:uncharacterized protein (DUF885 family)